MFRISNFTDNDDVRVLDSAGPFTIIEYMRDLSVSPSDAEKAYFCHAMNVRKRHFTIRSYAVDCGKCQRHYRIKGCGRFLWKGCPWKNDRRRYD